MSQPFNETYRFGSARWAEAQELRRAGLFTRKGPQIGFSGGRGLYLDGDAPMVTIGGAGSGKLRDQLGYTVCDTPGQRMMILDPRGELARISMIAHAIHREHAWCWNPVGMAGLPRHACNPLSILNAASPNFHGDCKFVVEGLIPLSGSSNGQYFELRAREWLEAFIKAEVELRGVVTLPAIWRMISVIEADPKAWADHLEAMLGSRYEGVRRSAGEMLAKQQDTPKEFGAILGELYAHLSFLDDPALQAALEGPGFDIALLMDRSEAAKVFLNIPAEYLSLWSPVIRLFFVAAMLHKGRRPEAPRLMLLVDEAGQLGRFEALLRAFTFGRGAGVRAWALFQDCGQITRNYGAPALQGFLGSAQMRQFFGVRDLETARLVSGMLGSETLTYDDPLQQQAAQRKKWETLQAVMEGADPLMAGYDYAHFKRASEHRMSKERALMTPDEVMAMPENRQVLFISGKDLPPIYAEKFPYFTRRELAGKYLPNPYHPPSDAVPVATRWGTRWREVINEHAPEAFRSFPQYADGVWSYVAGHCPR